MAGPGYSRARMLGAAAAFAPDQPHLRGLAPIVLTLDGPLKTLQLEMGEIRGPTKMGLPARARHMKSFNPSIAKAPDGLCPRCAWVVSVRVDALHQCDRSSPLLRRERGMPQRVDAGAFFKGTALAVLDAARRRVLGWTWLLRAPEQQVRARAAAVAPNASAAQLETADRWGVPVGAADGFPPPWAKPAYDARLLELSAAAGARCPGGERSCSRLLVTYACPGCRFSVSHAVLTATPAADGGLRELRAWVERRAQPEAFGAAWLRGRNQALFVAPAADALGAAAGGGAAAAPLLAQSALGLIGALGTPRWARAVVLCPAAGRAVCGTSEGEVRLDRFCLDDYPAARADPPPPPAERSLLPAPRPAPVALRASGEARLLYNHSALLAAALGAPGQPRLSTTANLLRIVRGGGDGGGGGGGGGDGPCEALLGIGHLHRGRGGASELHPRHPPRAELPPAESSGEEAFAFGYAHFFYTLSPRAPYAPLATSAEFCVESAQDAEDCESVQFISGAALEPAGAADPAGEGMGEGRGDALVLSIGVNDCEAKLGRLELAVARVWSMLTPLPGALDACLNRQDLSSPS